MMTTTNNPQTVAEVLKLIEAGHDVSDAHIDFSHIKVEALDAMQLNKHGISVPEDAIYYDDDNIVIEDDDIPIEQLTPLKEDPADQLLTSVIKINLDQHVREWVVQQNIQLDKLAADLITGFYHTHKSIVSKD